MRVGPPGHRGSREDRHFDRRLRGGPLWVCPQIQGSVFGLDSDSATLRKAGKDDRDVFGLHFNQTVINSIGMAAAANVGHQFLEVGGKDLYRGHVKPSGFPVEAKVVEVDKGSQHIKKKLFYGRFGNGTRAISDPAELEKYQVQVWGD